MILFISGSIIIIIIIIIIIMPNIIRVTKSGKLNWVDHVKWYR